MQMLAENLYKAKQWCNQEATKGIQNLESDKLVWSDLHLSLALLNNLMADEDDVQVEYTSA